MKIKLWELMKALVQQKKKFVSNFSKANTKFCLDLHYNADNSYFFVNEKEIFQFKFYNKNVNFPTQFCLLYLMDLVLLESSEVYLNGNVFDFSVD